MLNLYFYCMTVILKVDLYLHLFALFIQLCSVSGIKEYLCSVFMPLKMSRAEFCHHICIETREAYFHNQGEGSWFSLWIIIPNIYDLIPDSVCVRHHILSVCLSLFFLPLLHVGIPTVTTEADAAEKPGSDSGSNALNCVSALTEKLQRDTAKSGGMSK